MNKELILLIICTPGQPLHEGSVFVGLSLLESYKG